MHHFQKLLLPALVFQGVIVAGGYATGRELVHFFLTHGAIAALLGLLIVAVVWAVGLIICFELTRLSGFTDYKHFLQQLLGKYWQWVELLLAGMLLLVAAVIVSTAGEVTTTSFQLEPIYGMLLLTFLTIALATQGGKVVELFLSVWSLFLYITFAALTIQIFMLSSSDIVAEITTSELKGGAWLADSFAYAAYNLSGCLAILFSLHHITQRKQAVIAGVIAGGLAVIPAALLLIAMMAYMPEITSEKVPSLYLLNKINNPVFTLIFQIVFLGTLVQTGVSLIHSVNQRLELTRTQQNKLFTRSQRCMVATSVMMVGLLAASLFDLINIVAVGYTIIGAGFLVLFVIPLFTVGLYKVMTQN
jgi:uncharacterized membrane protein YkvI